MLVLFDIDATLLKTDRSGLAAMKEAFRALWSRDCALDGVHYAGRLDPLIMAEVLELNGVTPSAENLAAFRAGYRRGLEDRLARPGVAKLLLGARELVESLAEVEGLILGLCTGNYEDTGRIKLRAAGLDASPFVANAFGDESELSPPHRRHLPPVAMRRAASLRGRELRGAEVVVIGDTPADVDCARANGCRSIGVASGLHDEPTLAEAGADLVAPSLADTVSLKRFILGS